MISLANVSTNSIAIDDEWNFGNDDEYLTWIIHDFATNVAESHIVTVF